MSQVIGYKRLALIEFHYDIKFNEAEAAILREIAWVDELYHEKDATDSAGGKVYSLYERKVVIDYDRAPEINKRFTVLKIQSGNQWEDLNGRSGTVINQRVNVAVPGVGLLRIGHVEVMEDCCTNTLQHRLDDGWRILAICPQPDQRRPDYVLGRIDQPEEE